MTKMRRLTSMGHVLASRMCHWLDMHAPLRLFLCGLVLPFALAPSALVQPAGALTTLGRPPFNLFTPPEAVDHVARIVVTRLGGPPRTKEVTVFRSGAWQREETRMDDGVVSNQYADFARGISLTWSRNGGREYFHARQDMTSGLGIYIRERTSETQTWAGETCEVWAWRSEKERASTWLSCVTKDGVELWQGIKGGYDGKVTEYFHATHIERRALRPEEVQMPTEVLDWTRWVTGLPMAARPSIIDHEVTLSDDRGSEIIVRKSGAWMLKDRRRSRISPSYSLHHPQASLTFTDTEYGRSLTLQRDTLPAVPVPDRMEPVRLENPPPETILDRRCTWFNTTPNMADAGRAECRDADGVVLGLKEWSRGRGFLDLRATRLELGAPPEAAFAPPTEAFSWITG